MSSYTRYLLKLVLTVKIPCDGCGEIFPSTEIWVGFPDRFWCKDCKPENIKTGFITVLFTLHELIALEEILDGKMNLELIESRKSLKENVRQHLYAALQRVIKHDDVFKD